MKQSYKDANYKHFTRDLIIPRGRNVVGLAGPDTKEYIDFFRNRGYTNISIWENDSNTIIKQIPQIMNKGIIYNIGDIINAPIHSDTLYDLDFCCSMKSIEPHLKKFEDNFILTVSEMWNKKWDSINTFLEIRGEHIVNHRELSDKEHLVLSNRRKYMIYRYFDTSPMVVIKSI